MNELKIVTYNVNGIRAAITKGLVDWVKETNPDILCFQEIKATPEQVDLQEWKDLGYQVIAHSAEKKGYSGVATLTKIQPQTIEIGMNNPKYDSEGRVLLTQFDAFTLANIYFPSGSSGEDRHAFKLEFLEDILGYLRPRVEAGEKLIVVGDYNIVHREADIHNPDRKDNPSGYRPEERAWMDRWFAELGMVDAFRHLNPDAREYSWWSYRAGSRKKNLGWRIDYVSVPASLSGGLVAAKHHPDAAQSDHCALEVRIKI